MELKKITEDAHFQDKQSNTKPPPFAEAVEDNDGVLERSNGLKTPTSALNTIQPILKCPPAPRKPKAASLRKRKGSTELRLLDFSNDVLALYPPALLADYGNKMKKAKTVHEQQLKENITTNINYYTI